MKKLISILSIALLTQSVALGDCDFSKIVKNADSTFTYSKELHICVGEMKRDLELSNAKLDSYNKVIELKDLALTKADARADLWMNTGFKLQDRMNAVDELQMKNQWLMFGLGVIFTSLSVYGAGQLR